MNKNRPQQVIAIILTAVLLMLPAPVPAADIQGVSFGEDISVNGKRLTLRGLSVLRHLMFIRAYAGAFYLLETEAPDNALADVERVLVLHYFHAIPAKGFADATAKMIEKNVSPDQYRQLTPRIEELNRLYRDVTPGDRYTATYIPGTGTRLALNDELLGTVQGPDFSKAFFSIWIGENPIDKSFRDDLLSGAGRQP